MCLTCLSVRVAHLVLRVHVNETQLVPYWSVLGPSGGLASRALSGPGRYLRAMLSTKRDGSLSVVHMFVYNIFLFANYKFGRATSCAVSLRITLA